MDLLGSLLGAGTGAVRYARGVDETPSAPWAEPPATRLAGRALDSRATARAPWADPPELVAVRASVREAQERVDRATRQLELAAELEARLGTMLLAQPPLGLLRAPSPQREAIELEATRMLLQAELRAAKILNNPDDPELAMRPSAISSELARALAGHLEELTDIESGLIEIARQFVELEDAGSITGHLPDDRSMTVPHGGRLAPMPPNAPHTPEGREPL
jgi:hypothetical protein